MSESKNTWRLGEGVPGLVSYIIPAYNAAELIQETLDSCYRQTYRPIEVVVVDDGSTDDTGKIVEAFRERYSTADFSVVYHRQANRGVAAARNEAVMRSHGDLVGFIDADDVLPRRRTDILVQALLETNADLAYGGHRRFTQVTDVTVMDRVEPSYEVEPVALVPVLRFVPAIWAFVTKRRLVEQTGPFVEQFKNFGEDIEFVLRMRCQDCQVVRCRDDVLFYRQRPGSITKSWNPNRARTALRVHQANVETLRKFNVSEPESWKRVPELFFATGLLCLRYGLGLEASEAFGLAAQHGSGMRKNCCRILARACRNSPSARLLQLILRSRDRTWVPLRQAIQRVDE